MAGVSQGTILSTLLVSARIFTLFGEYSSTVSQDSATFIFFLAGLAYWVQSSWDISNIGLTWYISFVSHTKLIWKQQFYKHKRKYFLYYLLIGKVNFYKKCNKIKFIFSLFKHKKKCFNVLLSIESASLSKINKHCKWNAIRKFECQINNTVLFQKMKIQLSDYYWSTDLTYNKNYPGWM